MVFGESERCRWRVARSVLLYASTRAAEIATLSSKNASHLGERVRRSRIRGSTFPRRLQIRKHRDATALLRERRFWLVRVGAVGNGGTDRQGAQKHLKLHVDYV